MKYVRVLCERSPCARFSTSTYCRLWKKKPEEEFDLAPAQELHPVKESKPVEKKSGISDYHRCLALGLNPVEAGIPLPYKRNAAAHRRRLFGEFGLSSGVQPGEVYLPRESLKRHKMLEELANPKLISEMMDEIKSREKEKMKQIMAREAEVERKLSQSVTLRTQLEEKIKRKEAEIQAQKEKKERMMAEIREHFGYTVDPKTEKFQTMLAEKEALEKKKEKEAKKKEKEARKIAKLLTRTVDSASSSAKTPETSQETFAQRS